MKTVAGMYLGHCNGSGYADPTPVEPAPPPPTIIDVPSFPHPRSTKKELHWPKKRHRYFRVLCIIFILPLAPNRGSPNARSPMSSKSKEKNLGWYRYFLLFLSSLDGQTNVGWFFFLLLSVFRFLCFSPIKILSVDLFRNRRYLDISRTIFFVYICTIQAFIEK